MLNRRRFMLSAAVGGALLARSAGIFAADAKYDLLIKGGRVIDPSVRLDAVRDVAIAGGKIAAVEAQIIAEAAETIDAAGKLVVPGLIDIHTHAGRNAEAPQLLLADGVTGWIDAGSAGADAIGNVVTVAQASRPQPAGVLLNIGRAGIIPEGDTKDLALADVAAARDAIARYPGWVVGIKARLTQTVTGATDYQVLMRAQEAAGDLPVMIHMGQSATSLPRLLPLLKRGDIVTHMFAPPPHAIIDESGRILPAVLAARRRGVVFDVGNGVRDHIRWDIVDQVMRAGFWPDTFSTDWNVMSRATGVVDFANCLSKFLGTGMSLSEVLAGATVNAARTFPTFEDRGTLNVGAPADVTVLELRDGEFEFLDNYENKRIGKQRLFPSATVLGGKRVARV
jgi:dihydroorotase